MVKGKRHITRRDKGIMLVGAGVIALSVFMLISRAHGMGALSTINMVSMPPKQWMSILYPPLTGILATNAVLTFLYWYRVRRVPMVLMAALMHASDAVITAILSGSTGINPVTDIEQMRQLLVYSRFSLFFFGLLCAITSLKLLIHYDKYASVIEVPKIPPVED